jgi:hypothetical protein
MISSLPRSCRRWLAGDEGIKLYVVLEVAIAGKPAPTELTLIVDSHD